MMTSTSPSLQISKDGEKWTFAFKVLTKSNSISFEVCKDQSHIVLLQHSCQIGEEFSEENPALGETNKVVAEINKDGNLALKTEHSKSGVKAIRTFIPTATGITMVKTY